MTENTEPRVPGPKDVKEVVERCLVELPPETLQKLKDMDPDDLCMCHFGLGMYIRNKYMHTNPDYVGDVEPDFDSMRVVGKLWKRLNGWPDSDKPVEHSMWGSIL